MSRFCLCGRTAAGDAAIPLGPGRNPVSSLAGISPLFCYAPTDRVDLLSLWADDSAKPAILLLVRKSPARFGLGRLAIGTTVFGARRDDHGLSGETKGLAPENACQKRAEKPPGAKAKTFVDAFAAQLKVVP